MHLDMRGWHSDRNALINLVANGIKFALNQYQSDVAQLEKLRNGDNITPEYAEFGFAFMRKILSMTEGKPLTNKSRYECYQLLLSWLANDLNKDLNRRDFATQINAIKVILGQVKPEFDGHKRAQKILKAMIDQALKRAYIQGFQETSQQILAEDGERRSQQILAEDGKRRLTRIDTFYRLSNDELIQFTEKEMSDQELFDIASPPSYTYMGIGDCFTDWNARFHIRDTQGNWHEFKTLNDTVDALRALVHNNKCGDLRKSERLKQFWLKHTYPTFYEQTE